jgi:hypothetical protein
MLEGIFSVLRLHRARGEIGVTCGALAVILMTSCENGNPTERAQASEADCQASQVHYEVHPDAEPNGLLPAIPWVRADPQSSQVDAFLFYYAGAPFANRRDPRATIYTNGKSPNGAATKIMWVIPKSTDRLTIIGTRIPDGTEFKQDVDSIGSGWFPSGIVVPEPGCWRLNLRSGGTRAEVVFRAVAGAA